jgi:hypothetical protein
VCSSRLARTSTGQQVRWGMWACTQRGEGSSPNPRRFHIEVRQTGVHFTAALKELRCVHCAAERMVTESAQDLSAQNEILWCLLDATETWLHTKCQISSLQTHIERGVGAHQMPQLRDSLRALIVNLDQFQLNVLDEITTADVASDQKREMLRARKRDITTSVQDSREWLEQALVAARAHS